MICCRLLKLRARQVPLVKSRIGPIEITALAFGYVWQVLPRLWLATPNLAFADYSTHPVAVSRLQHLALRYTTVQGDGLRHLAGLAVLFVTTFCIFRREFPSRGRVEQPIDSKVATNW